MLSLPRLPRFSPDTSGERAVTHPNWAALVFSGMPITGRRAVARDAARSPTTPVPSQARADAKRPARQARDPSAVRQPALYQAPGREVGAEEPKGRQEDAACDGRGVICARRRLPNSSRVASVRRLTALARAALTITRYTTALLIAFAQLSLRLLSLSARVVVPPSSILTDPFLGHCNRCWAKSDYNR